MTTRGNKQIWRICRYVYHEFIRTGDYTWLDFQPHARYKLYDQVIELMKKINNNEFTGEDNHE